MRLILWLLIIGIVIGVWTPTAEASFVREIEKLQRTRHRQILDDLERGVQLRIEEIEIKTKEEKEELEKKELEEELEKEEAPEEVEEGAPKPLKEKLPEEMVQKILPSEEYLKTIVDLQLAREPEDSPWNIHTGGHIGMRRESNTFLRRIDAVGETELFYGPSISARKWFRGWLYETNYDLTHVVYKNFSHNDTLEHNWNQRVTNKGENLNLTFFNNMEWDTIRSEMSDIKPSSKIDQDYGGTASFKVSPKLRMTTGYWVELQSFRNAIRKSSNVRRHHFQSGISYRWTPKTSLRFDYSIAWNRPPKGLRSEGVNTENFLFRMNGRFSQKLFYSIGLGLGRVERKIEELELIDYFLVQSSFTYLYSPKTSLTFSIVRDRRSQFTLNETGDDPTTLELRYRINHKWSPKISIYGGQSWEFINDLGIRTVIDPDYPHEVITAERRDLHYDTTAGLNYNLDRNSNVNLRYRYEQVSSNLKLNDRINHDTNVSYNRIF